MGWTYATAIELKRSMHEANHSSPSNAEIKNRHIYILVLRLSLYVVVLNYVWKYLRFLPFILVHKP